MRAARSEGRIPSGPGQRRTPSCGASMSSKPFSRRAWSMRRLTASQGRRISAPIIGGPTSAAAAKSVKGLDELGLGIYRQATLPTLQEGGAIMATSVNEEIKVGGMAVRFLVEGEQSA